MRKRSMIGYGREFAKHMLPAVIKPARTLWHEVIGFLFLSMAIIFGFNAFRTYRALSEIKPGDDTQVGLIIKLVMTLFCMALMGGYGISSFLRARKISRS